MEKAYELVHREVLFLLENEDYLNIMLDESRDIADRRIINMCIVTLIGAFYYKTKDSKDESQTAQMLFEWMMMSQTVTKQGRFHAMRSIDS